MGEWKMNQSHGTPPWAAMMPWVLMVPLSKTAGSMSTQEIIRAQGGEPWNWFIFHSPMMFLLFFIYFAAALAEGSRTPFDLPEAESELVSGYNTEYSGFRFAAYFLSEFANTWIAAAVAVIVFLGGWQTPFATPEFIAQSTGWWRVWFEFAGVVFFALKTFALVFVIIQLRWTLPRVRVDQMMTLCWKYLVPVVFACTFLILGWMLILPWESTVALVLRIIFAMGGGLLLIRYALRVRYNIKSAKAEVDFNLAV